ncbi:MAG: DNA gyrase inhibitor YacG [Pseudomonadota bacterium]
MTTETKKCPQCGKPVTWENNPYKPFCCERCKLIDLGNWAAEKYRVPGEKATQHDEDEQEED